jgi:ABC-type polysaccharide transport system permease subunit
VQFHEWTMAKTVGIALLDLILLNCICIILHVLFSRYCTISALSKFEETSNENQVHLYHTYSFFPDFCSIIFGV